MLQIGSIVDRKYKILSEVGHGGMSVVYLAINERANKTWAIKEVRKDGTIDFEAVKQGLIVETDMLKKLHHPNLPSIIDVIDAEDSFLIVMDYIEGRSLQSVLQKGGAQPPELVIKWGKQICDVLGYLHSRTPPIIYRDMKPANLMLKPDGNIALIDFGTAREFKNRAMVEDTTVLGTRGYAAPEQYGGRGQTDPRTDIYCTGATLYHLLTGHSPAEPPYEIKPLRYWDQRFAGSGLEKLINKCCQQDPADRYQNCAELMYALEHVSDEDDAARRRRKNKWRCFVASLCLCLAGIGGMVGFHFAEQSAQQQSYDSYISQAGMSANDLYDTYQYCMSAIKIDPTRAEAYEQLVDFVQKDGKLSEEEDKILLEFIQSRESNAKTNLERLKAADRGAYDRLNFRLGKIYFLMYHSADNNYAQAAGFFGEVLDSNNLDENEKDLANALWKIGNAYDTLDSKGLFTESEYTYSDYWNDLSAILEDGTVDRISGYDFRIALYSQIAYEIYQHAGDFQNDGVPLQEMEDSVTQIEAALDALNQEIQATEHNRKLYTEIMSEAQNAVAQARTDIDTRLSREEG